MKKRYLILAGLLVMTVAAAGCGDYISWNDNADGNFCLNIMAEDSV